jgi:transposase InsO family protein
VDALVTAFGHVARDLSAAVWVLPSQLLTAVLRRPLELGQYVSAAYGKILDAHELRQSVGLPGTCWDNAVAESFFATLKNELIYLHAWPTRRSARSAIFAFIEGWYNRARLHSTLEYSSPNAYEEDYHRLSVTA